MPTIVCYGDSNTHGADPGTLARFPRHVRWPGVLAAELATPTLTGSWGGLWRRSSGVC